WLTGEIIARSATVGDDVLDRPIESSIEGIDAEPTLRSVTDRLVSQLEMWIGALEGHDRIPGAGDTTPTGMRERLDVAGPRFRSLLAPALAEGRADDTFIDASCDPPETFTFAGMLAHVLTFSAVRRTTAIGALETAGVGDLGAGDPMRFVGGSGNDTSRIRRRSG